MEARLVNQLQRRLRDMDDYTTLIRLKREYKLQCRDILLRDIESAHEAGLDQSLWKTAYYQPIELLRRMLSERDEHWAPAILAQNLQAILHDGMEYYTALSEALQQTYGFDLSAYYDTESPAPGGLGRRAKLALYSAHQSLLCMGDLARYTEQQRHGTNYSQARDYYEKARLVMPKNGRPYNQLAILSMYTKKLTDAVYYFVRSLAASKPFLNGKEILHSIFDDVRRRVQATEAAREAERAARRRGGAGGAQRPWTGGRGTTEGRRVEVWVRPDGSRSREHAAGQDEEQEDLSSLSPQDLHRRFHTSYLYVQGRLYTGVDMDAIPVASARMLEDLAALLRMPGARISGHRLLQLVAINMYAVYISVSADPGVAAQDMRTVLEEQAMQLGLEMYAVLAERCTELLDEHLLTKNTNIFSRELEELVPSVLVWLDWMTVNQDCWNPPPLGRDPSTGNVLDIWGITARLCNAASRLDCSHVTFYKSPEEGCVAVVLQEDVQMAGFVPLALFTEEETYVDAHVNMDVARNCLRAQKLRFFGEFLQGQEEPLVRWNAQTHCIEPVYNESDVTQPRSSLATQRQISEDDVIIEAESDEDSDTHSHVSDLKARKQQLEQRVKHQEQLEATRAQVVHDEHSTQRLLEITVTPRHLVPDTNCFIDHLPALQALLSTYQLVIPLIVITELDGLQKNGAHNSTEQRHSARAGQLRTRARDTMTFLEAQFSARNPQLRAITSEGSILENITFRSEQAHDQSTNDDAILRCCEHFCKDRARDFMPATRDEPIRLQRDVVLLTDDRNLRVKAHIQNVPVKSVSAFLSWAKIT